MVMLSQEQTKKLRLSDVIPTVGYANVLGWKLIWGVSTAATEKPFIAAHQLLAVVKADIWS